jgi:ParB family transcriptional regulator, chromosome partitioning protein
MVTMVTTETPVPSPVYEHGRLYEMPLADLMPDPNQPRKFIDPAALTELTESIRQQGVVTPILFRTDSNGLAYVIAGERRCAAALRAGLTTIPAVYMDKPNYEEIALIENIVRADLTAVEEAEALERLRYNSGYKQEDLARIIGKTVASISQTLSLNKLPQAIRDECRAKPSVPKHVLIGIAAKKQERSMLKAYAAYKASLNPVQKPRSGGVTKLQGAVNAASAAGKKIEALDSRALSAEDKETLATALNGLKGIVETALTAITEPVTRSPKRKPAAKKSPGKTSSAKKQPGKASSAKKHPKKTRPR